MKRLLEIIHEAEEKKVAIGHFNISNLEGFWGIVKAAKKLDVPVVIGVSEGERDYVGVRQTIALVHSFRDEYGYPIYANADHTYSLDRIKEAIEAGFDSVIFDGAKLSNQENTVKTKEVVDFVKSTGKDVLVEAEVGYIGTSSKLLDELPEGATQDEAAMPTGEDVKTFVQATGVDLISPAVGNIHGMLKDRPNPELHIDRIKEIKELAGVPLVLHGGSGIRDDNFREAIKAGISMIHINTEIRKAWKDAAAKSFLDNPDEVAPYKLMQSSVDAVAEVVTNRLKLFSNLI